MNLYILRYEYRYYDPFSGDETVSSSYDNLGVFSSREKAKAHAQETTKNKLEWIDRGENSYTRAITGNQTCYIIEQTELDEGWYI